MISFWSNAYMEVATFNPKDHKAFNKVKFKLPFNRLYRAASLDSDQNMLL